MFIRFCLLIFLLNFINIAKGVFDWNTITSHTICHYVECCNDDYIPFDIESLQQNFSKKLYGQPLVYELIDILRGHKEALKKKTNKKALVISLHGSAGLGKNYATNMIVEAIYKKGLQSDYVKMFMGKKDFSCAHAERAQEELISKIHNIIKKCPKSLIIFDEIHEMCNSVLDVIKPLLDHYHEVDGVDYRDSIFIFISNIGGKEIATRLLNFYSNGVRRKDVKFQDFEPLIRQTAYKSGGFENSAIIAQHLINHYIPFLPLEQHHVEQCALAEFRGNGIVRPTKEMMQDALSVIVYGPNDDQRIFANGGCKRLPHQVRYVIQKHNLKDEL